MFTGVVKDEELAVHGESSSLLFKSDSFVGVDRIEQIKTMDVQNVSSHNNCPDGIPDAKRKWEHAATLHYFLDRKEYLIEALKTLNLKVENDISVSRVEASFDSDSNSSCGVVTSCFSEQYQWVLKNISRTNNIIKQLFKQFDSEQLEIEKHDASIFRSSGGSSSRVSILWRDEFLKLGHIALSNDVKADPGFKISSGDFDEVHVISLLKTFTCCLMVLKKYLLDEFCQPTELCDFLIEKLDEFKHILPVQAFTDKIEAICFRSS